MYYNIRLDWDPKVIGVKNGVYQVELDEKAYDKKTLKELKSMFIGGDLTANQLNSKIDFKFYFKKLKSAKKTSVMSFTPYLNHCHFLANEDTYTLFERYSLQRHINFETVIYDSPNESLDNSYRLFCSVLQDWNVIDFDKTIFTSGGFGNNPKVEHAFADENDMRKFNGIIKVKTLALAKSFDSTLDFFHTRLGGLFVSEELKLELERNNVTGIKFTDEVKVLTNSER
jgi:hypothetical protein